LAPISLGPIGDLLRIARSVVRAGRDAVEALPKKRRQVMKTPQCFLWKKHLCAFYANFISMFQAVEKYKKAGRVVDWNSSL